MQYNYSFKDIDLCIECIRVYSRKGIPLPVSLLNVTSDMCKDDLRLSLYFHHRILRYPSVVRALALREAQTDEEVAQDDIPESSPIPGSPAIAPEFQDVRVGELMFQ